MSSSLPPESVRMADKTSDYVAAPAESAPAPVSTLVQMSVGRAPSGETVVAATDDTVCCFGGTSWELSESDKTITVRKTSTPRLGWIAGLTCTAVCLCIIGAICYVVWCGSDSDSESYYEYSSRTPSPTPSYYNSYPTYASKPTVRPSLTPSPTPSSYYNSYPTYASNPTNYPTVRPTYVYGYYGRRALATCSVDNVTPTNLAILGIGLPLSILLGALVAMLPRGCTKHVTVEMHDKADVQHLALAHEQSPCCCAKLNVARFHSKHKDRVLEFPYRAVQAGRLHDAARRCTGESGSSI